MKKKNQKPTVEIKTRKVTKSDICVNLFKLPYIERKTITYEMPYFEIQIPFKHTQIK